MTQRRAPRFSVIVPIYEQWHLLCALMERLAEQTLAHDEFEIIVVDNGSVAVRPELVSLPNAQLLHSLGFGSYAARNEGARRACGEWLVFTDADCLPERDWLDCMARAAQQGENASSLLAGAVEMRASSPSPSSFEIYDLLKGIPQARYVKRGYAATANLAVPRLVFEQLGGFDNTRLSGGDADFCRRAGAAGFPIRYVPQARVGHPARTSWADIVTKARRIKGGQLRSGSRRRRLAWAIRTMLPPVCGAWLFLRRRDKPLNHRVLATIVLFLLWFVEVWELFRLLTGRKAERR
ncbi:glycosyltransferase family 2 protein [Chelativorans sp. ZYF759]|uniref:glycosyltransferase family 2 protein n=1 Tax=Chelativorans sp. ZYF759 TaxID=2692213 RepID=UPI0034D468EA